MTENRLAANPYAPPQAAVDDVVPGEDRAVRIRQEHLLHEIRLKSVGTLYFLGALMLGLMGVAALTGTTRPAFIVTTIATMVAVGVAFAAVGYGFRKLAPWVVVPGAVLAVLGLLAFPLGTMINAYVLYLLFCAKGRTVLGKDYAAIMAATPTLKYRRTLGDWIAIGIVVALLVTVIVMIAIR